MTDKQRANSAGRTTLSVIARAAGVSTATVSKVLNHRPDVAQRTRRHVEAVLQEYGYEPTTGPREASPGQMVVVVFDTLENVYSTQVLRGILAAAKEMGVHILVEELGKPDGAAGGNSSRRLSPAWIRSAAQEHRLGVLTVTTAVERAEVRAFHSAGLPLVAIDPPNEIPDMVTSVASTNFTGGVQAANHLLELGHRRIALAGGPENSFTASQRKHGYRSALEAAGIDAEDQLILHGEFTYEAGVAMGLALLNRDDPPSAIFTGCDLTALGVLEAARQMAVQVPRHLSVVGYDDSPAALWSAPPLTTIRQPITSLGRIALRALVQQSAGEEPASHRIELATTLVRRESTSAQQPVQRADGRQRRPELHSRARRPQARLEPVSESAKTSS